MSTGHWHHQSPPFGVALLRACQRPRYPRRALALTVLSAAASLLPAGPADVRESAAPAITEVVVAGPFVTESRPRPQAVKVAPRRERLAGASAHRRASRSRRGPNFGALAACESTNNPRAISPNGRYRGLYQFTFDTWASVGGSGDPAQAPRAEQTRRARALYVRRGRAPWPVCGAFL